MLKIVASTIALSSLLALAACGEEQPSEDARAPTATDSAVVDADEPAQDVAFADLTGDAVAGEAVFTQCRTCHMIEDGKNAVGPTLYGVVGREAGSVGGFNYSDANANADVTWTAEVLYDYLKAPRDFMPGTRMAFAGIKDAQDRADLIAYLASQGGE